MALENVLVYNFASGDSTYPHSGTFTIGTAGSLTIDDSDGFGDAIFGDYTHTDGGDVFDQNVTSSSVAGIDVGDAVDVRYKYTITGSDGSTGTIHFLATNGSFDYGPLFVSSIPLDPAVTYTFGAFNTDGAVAYSDLVPCFTSGTMIMTNKGEKLIDTLKIGDLVLTRDNGHQPIRWIGHRTIAAQGNTAPVLISKGLLNNHSDLLVSPNHRMLIVSPKAGLYFSENEVFVSAKNLMLNEGIVRKTGGLITYIHILFDQHEVVLANGAFSESFFPGTQALNSLGIETRQEVLELFPELASISPTRFRQTARLCLNKREAETLNKIAA